MKASNPRILFIYYRILAKLKSCMSEFSFAYKRYRPKYLGGRVFSIEGNEWLYKKLESGEPFAAIRYGGNELERTISQNPNSWD